MSKTKRKQRQRKSFPWPLLVFGGLLLIIAAFLFASRGGASGGSSDGTGTPRIVADPDKIDYGYVTFGNNETFSIKVTNTGTGLLRFKEKPYIEVVEGC